LDAILGSTLSIRPVDIRIIASDVLDGSSCAGLSSTSASKAFHFDDDKGAGGDLTKLNI
jgi:hypothetical protein